MNIDTTTECATCGAVTYLWNKRRDGTGYDCDSCRRAVQAEAAGLPAQSDLPPGAVITNLGGWCMGVQFAMSDDSDGPYRLLTPADTDAAEWWVGTYTNGLDTEGTIEEFTTLDEALTALTRKEG